MTLYRQRTRDFDARPVPQTPPSRVLAFFGNVALVRFFKLSYLELTNKPHVYVTVVVLAKVGQRERQPSGLRIRCDESNDYEFDERCRCL